MTHSRDGDEPRGGQPRGGSGPSSALDDLTDALGGCLSAVGSGLADRAGALIGDLTHRLAGSADGRGSGSRGGGRGDGVKATHILETVDVGVPVRTAYDQWTRYEDFSGFTKGVRGVSRSGDVESDWNLKVGPSSRGWRATVREQVPDDRIMWTSEGAKGSTRGAVTFHALAPRLTRIVVVVEYYPAGFFEKTGNLWRAQGRRLRLDLKHFARHVTLHGDEETQGWRGEIRDGEVVRGHEEAVEEEGRDERDAEAGGRDGDAYDEDDGDEEDTYDEDDEEDTYDEDDEG
ncbi:polyketide cyclase [Streptomyces fumigatiscleroticus]|nr:polyketide cyclase [Streptomyces fumigatiscleroticus]